MSELVFKSEAEAIQHLSDVSGDRVVIAKMSDINYKISEDKKHLYLFISREPRGGNAYSYLGFSQTYTPDQVSSGVVLLDTDLDSIFKVINRYGGAADSFKDVPYTYAIKDGRMMVSRMADYEFDKDLDSEEFESLFSELKSFGAKQF
jgi:hypothetical protein